MELTQVSDKLFVRPQVHVEEVAGLASAGFKGIINNRPEGEAPDQPSSDDLEAEATRHGLAYQHIPIVPGQMTEGDARAFAKALAQMDGPVIAFCRTGARSTNVCKLAQQLS
jgi:uncharacterized protein (TIGR01244 family)